MSPTETLQKFTPSPTQKRFLACFEACGSIIKACRWAKISRQNHYEWMQEVAGYKQAFDQARERAMDLLEGEAVRRAHDGVTKAVRYKGKVVGFDSEYSDALLIFLLKGGKPDRYRERFEHTGKDGGPITVDMARELIKRGKGEKL